MGGDIRVGCGNLRFVDLDFSIVVSNDGIVVGVFFKNGLSNGFL